MRKKVINNITLVLLVLLLFLFCEGLVQAAPKSPAEIISESISVLREMSSAEDSGAFGALLKKANGKDISNRTVLETKIPVNPEVLKILFLINKISRDSF